jgi:ATPase subunit of ABC transporter with duplicated ATPase domains
MNKNIKDFAVCLSTGIAKKLVPINIEEAIAKIIQALVDLYQQKQAHFKAQQEAQQKVQLEAQQQAQQEKDLAEAEFQRQEEKRRQDIETETKRQIVAKLAERQAAAQKALAEAAALAEERARRSAELQLEQERMRLQLEAEQAAEHLQRVQLANINVSSLNLGARIELIINNEPVRCKLAVIIAATGKYIFVDNLGRKIAELQRENLIQALLDNQLVLLNNGDSFDDQLVKVIRGLRKDIS